MHVHPEVYTHNNKESEKRDFERSDLDPQGQRSNIKDGQLFPSLK